MNGRRRQKRSTPTPNTRRKALSRSKTYFAIANIRDPVMRCEHARLHPRSYATARGLGEDLRQPLGPMTMRVLSTVPFSSSRRVGESTRRNSEHRAQRAQHHRAWSGRPTVVHHQLLISTSPGRPGRCVSGDLIEAAAIVAAPGNDRASPPAPPRSSPGERLDPRRNARRSRRTRSTFKVERGGGLAANLISVALAVGTTARQARRHDRRPTRSVLTSEGLAVARRHRQVHDAVRRRVDRMHFGDDHPRPR